MAFLRKGLYFLIGGTGYVGIELLWRGRSHISMFAAGGVCFLLIGLTGKRIRYAPARAVLGAAIITGVELCTGLLVNRGYSVWDYRELPMNYRGQICLNYSLLWIPISLFAATLYDLLDRSKLLGSRSRKG